MILHVAKLLPTPRRDLARSLCRAIENWIVEKNHNSICCCVAIAFHIPETAIPHRVESVNRILGRFIPATAVSKHNRLSPNSP